MTRPTCALVPLLLCACGLFGGPEGVPTDEDEALIFARRITAFYSLLEDIPIDAYFTYQNRELRSYFEDERAFSDYYASIAGSIRDAAFRNGRAEQVRIEQFRFERPGEARVDLTLVGRHIRRLRFWERKVYRTDTWRQVEGVWMLTPSKL
ncbi:MAG: hypothetical protein JRG76_12720 [Deltaproteobacteria bacterium]|nr:hypothetical protein [Deltaproteobacteria bacterium]MBW2415362.1 hypothetical protein [Deltaproteobacteria bacterium]